MTCQRYLLWIVYKCIVEGGTICMSCQSNFGWTVYEFKSKDEPSYIYNSFSCGPHNMYFYLEIIWNTFFVFFSFLILPHNYHVNETPVLYLDDLDLPEMLQTKLYSHFSFFAHKQLSKLRSTQISLFQYHLIG